MARGWIQARNATGSTLGPVWRNREVADVLESMAHASSCSAALGLRARDGAVTVMRSSYILRERWEVMRWDAR